MRARPLLLALALAALLAPPAGASAAVQVSFLQGEQMVTVQRPGAGLEDAVRQLLRGPTPAELRRHRQLRSYILPRTPVRGITVANGVATIDMGRRFVAGTDSETLLARLNQLVATAERTPGVGRVQVLIEGGTPLGLFPGVDASKPLTARGLATPDIAPPKSAPDDRDPPDEGVRAIQERLVELGFLPPGGADGRRGPQTDAAIIAFQKWERLARDGVVGPATQAALARATRPTPVTRGGRGRRAEVLLDRQLTLAIEDDRVVRVLHVSTGAAGTPTPTGSYRVYGKFPRWWSVPFQVWLPYAVAFVGGIAFHQYSPVPVQPASHGCVRLIEPDARFLYGFMSVGTPVTVVARS